MKSFLKKPRMD